MEKYVNESQNEKERRYKRLQKVIKEDETKRKNNRKFTKQYRKKEDK